MEKRTRNPLTIIPRIEDVPLELIQHIQSLLWSEKEATRTCILSKAWLHAWSTIPILRFEVCITKEEETKYMEWVDRIVQRYDRDNIPFETFDIYFDINDQKLISLAKTWIPLVTSKNCLTVISLKIWFPSNLSNESLETLTVTTNETIKCVFLRVLELSYVKISDEVLHNLLSTCNLLEIINLSYCKDLKTIKVKNLSYLRELQIHSNDETIILEIEDVPSLRSFHYSPNSNFVYKPLPFNTDALRSVRQLHIEYVMMNNAFFDMINLKFPFLECLTLGIGHQDLENLVIKSVSLKILKLVRGFNRSINVQVYAPKLVYFHFFGNRIPSLSFPTIVPERIKLCLNFFRPIDLSLLLKIRELALSLASKFDIEIVQLGNNSVEPLNINVDDLRRLISFPVTNVQQLSFIVSYNHQVWEDTRFFDAFFSICHPKYIKAREKPMTGEKSFAKLMVKEMIENKTKKLKDVELKNPGNGKWEGITSSWRSVIERLTDEDYVEFKLNWFSQ